MKALLVFLSVIVTLSLSKSLDAQDSASCDCQAVFEKLTQKLESDYIGYELRKGDIGEAYHKRISEFRPLVKDTNTLNCVATLQRFLTFFQDGHLFVSQFPKYSQEEYAVFKTSLRQRMYDTEALKNYLAERRESLGELEGVWTDGTTRYGIARNTNKDWPFQYVAVTLASPNSEKVGEFKLGVNLNHDKYEGIYYSNAYSPRYIKLDLAKDSTLLGIWGGLLWGRVAFSDRVGIDSAPLINPTRPTVEKLQDSTVLLTIPTFLIEKPVLDSVLMGNQEELTTCRNLIIDIRGNSGGNGIYFDLMSLYAEKPLKSEVGLALASEDNLAYFSQFAKGSENDPYQPVVDDMKQGIGKVVKGPRFSDWQLQTVPSKLRKVVILTDRSNISAAETFVLYSKGSSDKVVTIGTNTGGVVDYNNINMVKLSCDRAGIQFGYPTYTLNDHILKDGYNNKGIPPDIFSDKKGRELMEFTLEYLRK